MEIITQQLVDFEDLDLPEVIYKYRTWDDPNHKTILTDKQVFMSPPLGFKDPLDCKNHARFDLLTPKEIFDKYYLDFQILYPHLRLSTCFKMAKYWFKKSPIHKKDLMLELQEKQFVDVKTSDLAF